MGDAIPILELLIPALLGDRQSENAIRLADYYSPGGSSNLYLDKNGRIRPVDGWTKQNSSAKTTDTGASAATFRSLFHYKKIASGSVTRQLLGVLDDEVNEWEIHKSTDEGATWTLVSDRGATPVGQLPDWAQFGDTLIITVPKTEVPRLWDGTSISAAGPSQLAAPTAVDAATAGSLAGTFTWKVLPRKTTGVRKYASIVSNTLRLSASQCTLGWAADADTDVGGYEIYRTTGTGAILYYVGYVSGRLTITFTDNVPDTTIIQERALDEYGDAPPSGVYFIEVHKQRAWYGKTDTYPRRWWFGDPGLPDSVDVNFHYIDFTDAESFSDQCVGGTGGYDGMFVAWLERSIWTVSGSMNVIGLQFDYNRRRTSASIGTVHHRTVVRIPQGAKFTDASGDQITTTKVLLAYLTPLGDVRVFDGDHDTVVSSDLKDTLALLNYQNRGKAHSLIIQKYSLAVFCFPANSSTECDTAAVWDFARGAWFTWTGMNFASLVEVEAAAEAYHYLASQAAIATGGLVYKLFSGNNRDSAVIPAVLMTKPIFPPLSAPGGLGSSQPDFVQTKRFRSADLLFVKDSSPTTVTIGWLPYDAADSDSVTGSTTVSGSSRVRAKTQTSGVRLHSEGIRLKVSSSVTTGPWSLDGILLRYQPMTGKKRS